IAVARLLLAAGLTAGLLTACGSSKSPSHTNPAAVKFAPAQQVRLERRLTAPGIAAQASVVAGEVRNEFVRRGQSLLPAGSRMRIDSATFHAISSGTATVSAVITGPEPGHWQLLLVSESSN